jgi:hypothetical protein
VRAPVLAPVRLPALRRAELPRAVLWQSHVGAHRACRRAMLQQADLLRSYIGEALLLAYHNKTAAAMRLWTSMLE